MKIKPNNGHIPYVSPSGVQQALNASWAIALCQGWSLRGLVGRELNACLKRLALGFQPQVALAFNNSYRASSCKHTTHTWHAHSVNIIKFLQTSMNEKNEVNPPLQRATSTSGVKKSKVHDFPKSSSRHLLINSLHQKYMEFKSIRHTSAKISSRLAT